MSDEMDIDVDLDDTDVGEDVEVDYDDDAGDDDFDDSDEDEGGEDPWDWAKDVDPGDVKKTWTQYTQTRDEVLTERKQAEAMREELEPFVKLREEILADPGLVGVIDDYFKNSRPVDRELHEVKNEMQQLRSQIMTERELQDVQSWVDKNKYPKVDEAAILQHAVKNGIANLKSAYKDLMFDELQEFKADKMAKGIKKSRGAKSPTSKKPASGKNSASSKDIYNMTDEEFIKNYDSVLERYQK
jgi:hypothetical protein